MRWCVAVSDTEASHNGDGREGKLEPCLWGQSGGGATCANMVTVESFHWGWYSVPLSWFSQDSHRHRWCHRDATCCLWPQTPLLTCSSWQTQRNTSRLMMFNQHENSKTSYITENGRFSLSYAVKPMYDSIMHTTQRQITQTPMTAAVSEHTEALKLAAKELVLFLKSPKSCTATNPLSISGLQALS